MIVTFDYSVCYGKGDYGESYIEMELSEEEYARLKEAQDSGEEFYACKTIQNIYNRVYELAEEETTNDLIDAGILDKDRRASESYPIEVYYPEE